MGTDKNPKLWLQQQTRYRLSCKLTATWPHFGTEIRQVGKRSWTNRASISMTRYEQLDKLAGNGKSLKLNVGVPCSANSAFPYFFFVICGSVRTKFPVLDLFFIIISSQVTQGAFEQHSTFVRSCSAQFLTPMKLQHTSWCEEIISSYLPGQL